MTVKHDNFNILKAESPHLVVIEHGDRIASEMSPTFRIEPVSNHDEALAVVVDPFPRAVLISFDLPGNDPLELCRELKKDHRFARIPVILIAPELDEEIEILAINAGADDLICLSSPEELITLRIDRLANRLGEYHHRSSFLVRVDGIIFANMECEKFGVEELAGRLFMDRKTLYHRITKETGLTPQIYIRNIRICRAGHLLKRGTMTISEVAFEVGFNDVSYFSKCFKDYFKKLPTEFVKHYFTD